MTRQRYWLSLLLKTNHFQKQGGLAYEKLLCLRAHPHSVWFGHGKTTPRAASARQEGPRRHLQRPLHQGQRLPGHRRGRTARGGRGHGAVRPRGGQPVKEHRNGRCGRCPRGGVRLRGGSGRRQRNGRRQGHCLHGHQPGRRVGLHRRRHGQGAAPAERSPAPCVHHDDGRHGLRGRCLRRHQQR